MRLSTTRVAPSIFSQPQWRYTDGYCAAPRGGWPPDNSRLFLEPMDATILLIEDEAAIADTVVYALESDGFTVRWYALASEGEACLQQESIDLLLLDIGLPDDNGFEVCRRIREHHSLPVIFLTARKEEIDRIVGLEIGADDYVTKPFSPRELAARVRAVLRRTHNNQPTAQMKPAGSPFVLDDNRKQIQYKGQWLDLTRYEYRILHLLASRPNQVFSRDHLLEKAWDDPTQSFDRAVDTHIKTLRAKLRHIDPNQQPIRTHRGFGYSLTLDTAS